MERTGSLVVLLGIARLPGDCGVALAAAGWQVRHAADRKTLLAEAERDLPAAVIVGADADEILAAVRALPAPANGTPVIALDAREPRDGEALLARLRHWAGPLDDHALRRAPFGARYRLIRLLGLDAADAMIARFRDALREALELAESDPAAVPAHRLAGIAGMVGESELSTLWSCVDRGEAGALPPALAAARRALDEG